MHIVRKFSGTKYISNENFYTKVCLGILYFVIFGVGLYILKEKLMKSGEISINYIIKNNNNYYIYILKIVLNNRYLFSKKKKSNFYINFYHFKISVSKYFFE